MNKHVIEFHDLANGRVRWECDCGAAGSAPDDRVDIAAEKHVPEGDRVSYRAGGAS